MKMLMDKWYWIAMSLPILAGNVALAAATITVHPLWFIAWGVWILITMLFVIDMAEDIIFYRWKPYLQLMDAEALQRFIAEHRNSSAYKKTVREANKLHMRMGGAPDWMIDAWDSVL